MCRARPPPHSTRSATDRDLLAEAPARGDRQVVAAPELARVVPGRAPVVAEDAHLDVAAGHDLGAERRLRGDALTALAPWDVGVAAAEPPGAQPGQAGEGDPVEPSDGSQHPVLLGLADLRVELADPGVLVVLDLPPRHGLAQVVQLHASVVVAGPHVELLLAELGVEDQRRQVVHDHCHADVVDRRVGDRADRPVRCPTTAEQPDVAAAGEVHRLVEAQGHARSLHDRHTPTTRLQPCACGSGSDWPGSWPAWPPAPPSRATSGCVATTSRPRSGTGSTPDTTRPSPASRPTATPPPIEPPQPA